MSSLYAVNAFESRPSPWCLGRSASSFCGHAWCTRICVCNASMVLCRAGNGVTRPTFVSQTCCAVHLQTCNIPCSLPDMFVLGVRGVAFDASMRWQVRLRCVKVEHGSVRVYRGRAAPALFAQKHEPIGDTCRLWTVEGSPISCSSSKLVLRSWMFPSIASPVRRRWRPNAGDHSISLLRFRAQRCSFSGTVQNHVHGKHVAL